MRLRRDTRAALGALAGLGLMAIGALALLLAGLLLYAEHLRAEREASTSTALAPPGSRWVESGDAELFIRQWGPADGPLLLLSHGTGAWSGTWFDLPDALAAAGWRVIAVDLPPFGFSKTHAAPASADYRRAAQAKRLLALLAALGQKDVTLVGHSFGAGPALEAAMLDDGRLRQLVLVDPALGLGSNGEPPACAPEGVADAMLSSRALRSALVGGIATQPRFTPFLLAQFVHRKEAVSPARVPAYQQPFRQAGFSDGLGHWARAFARASCEDAQSLSPAALRNWSFKGLPVKLLWGEKDTVTPLAQARSLQEWMPQTTLDVIPQVGHIPHIEDPEAFARALIRAVGTPRPQ